MNPKNWRLIRTVHSKVNLLAAKKILLSPMLWLKIPAFILEYLRYRKLEGNKRLPSSAFQFNPLLTDKAPSQLLESTYLFQDSWGMRRSVIVAPREIVDVGSSISLLAFQAQFRPVKSVDVRPIVTKLPGISSVAGNMTALPFPDESVEYLQSLCVIEHIGLGRYGDPLDPDGSERAIDEVKRVIKKQGHVTLSVPVGPPCVCFNAHRIFSRDHVINWFSGWTLVEEYAIHPECGPGDWIIPSVRGQQIVICFHFQKP